MAELTGWTKAKRADGYVATAGKGKRHDYVMGEFVAHLLKRYE